MSKDPYMGKEVQQMRIHTLKKTNIDKLKGFFDVYCEAFEEVHPFPSDVALQRLMDHPSVLFIVGENGNGEVIGGMTVYVLPSLFTEKDYYIYDMAVKLLYQNKGVGKRLLNYIIGLGKEHQAETVYIEADEPDQAANHLYASFAVDTAKSTVYDLYQGDLHFDDK